MLVGQAMGGKSTIIHTLRQAYINLWERKVKNSEFNRIEYTILNPKSISMEELYGNYDPMT
jgi:dynein heavy chain, axonemal